MHCELWLYVNYADIFLSFIEEGYTCSITSLLFCFTFGNMLKSCRTPKNEKKKNDTEIWLRTIQTDIYCMYMYTGIHTNKFMRKMLEVLMLVAGMTRKIWICNSRWEFFYLSAVSFFILNSNYYFIRLLVMKLQIELVVPMLPTILKLRF